MSKKVFVFGNSLSGKSCLLNHLRKQGGNYQGAVFKECHAKDP